MVSKQQISFENLLHEILHDNHLNWNINSASAKSVAEEIVKLNHSTLEGPLKHIRFGTNYFKAFFSRYGWTWRSATVSGPNRYIPKSSSPNFFEKRDEFEPLKRPEFIDGIHPDLQLE